MKNVWIFLLITTVIFNACTDTEEPIIEPELPTIRENAVLLSDLKVGQISQYLRYETSCENNLTDFQYTGDTLNVEVIQKDGILYLQETFTKRSPLYISGSTDPVIHLIESTGTQVRIPERSSSNLLFFYGSDDIHLEPNDRVDLEQLGCKLNLSSEPFVGNEIGKVDQFKVGDMTIKDKTAVSCVPMLRLDGYLLYDKDQLHMSHTIIFEEFNGEVLNDIIAGWVLL